MASFSTLFPVYQSEVVERSKDRVSKLSKRHLSKMHGGEVTHPECSANWRMFDPLSLRGKRMKKHKKILRASEGILKTSL